MKSLSLRSILFAVLVPGTVGVLIPCLIVTGGSGTPHVGRGAVGFAAGAVIAAGAGILLRCIRDFQVMGRGTLAPIDPPIALVHEGLYRYVRNPMYVGMLLVLLGESALFRSTALVVYTAIWFAFVNAIVIGYEEPHLRRRFGAPYAEYCRRVGRWIPRRAEAGG